MTIYLDFGGIYYKPSLSESEARDHLRDKVVTPVVTEFQNVLDEMSGYWKKSERLRYECLEHRFRGALKRWELIQYPFIDRSVQETQLTRKLYTDAARLSTDHPMLSTEVRELAKLYMHDHESSKTIMANLLDHARIMRELGLDREVGYAIDEQFSYVYNPAKFTDEQAAEAIAPAAAQAKQLQIQRGVVARGAAERFSRYYAKFAISDVHVQYGE